ETTSSFVGVGVDPEGETILSSSESLVEGQPLSEAEPRGVLLGLGLARGFGVRPGDELTLLSTTKEGAIHALAGKRRGLWESGDKAYDDRFLKLPLVSAQRLIDAEGEVQSIALLLDQTENTAEVRGRISALIRERQLGLESKSWEELATEYRQVRALHTRIF